MSDYNLEQAAQDFRSIGDRIRRNNETLVSNTQKLKEIFADLSTCHIVSKNDLLDTLAAAHYLGVTNQDTIRNWLEGGSFPGAFQSRGQWFFPVVALAKVKRRREEVRVSAPVSKMPEPADFDNDCDGCAL